MAPTRCPPANAEKMAERLAECYNAKYPPLLRLAMRASFLRISDLLGTDWIVLSPEHASMTRTN